MKRRVIMLDRLATVVTAVVLVAAGLLALAWCTGLVLDLPDAVDSTNALDLTEQPWWPWALAGAGLVLILTGAWWLASHLQSQAVGRLTLKGSDKTGRLVADARSVAKAAGESFGATHGVRSSRATVTHDRGQMVARFTATVESDADLAEVARAADQVSAELRQVLDRDDLRCQVRLKVSNRKSGLPRVS